MNDDRLFFPRDDDDDDDDGAKVCFESRTNVLTSSPSVVIFLSLRCLKSFI